MSEVPFHATRMGRTYYERDVPELIRQLKRIGDGVERLVELNETTSKADGATAAEASSKAGGIPDP